MTLHHADLFDILPTLAEASVDACICDPPYHMTSVVRRFGKEGSAPAKTGVYARGARGFMGQTWDGGDLAFQPETWEVVCRVLKPGAYIAAFGATRGYHRLACAVEDAGFDIRDSIAWLRNGGFPKSHNTDDGRGTALKPVWEPVVVAQKPREGTYAANAEKHGTGFLNIDAARVPLNGDPVWSVGQGGKRGLWGYDGFGLEGIEQSGSDKGRWPCNAATETDDGAHYFFSARPSIAEKEAGLTGRTDLKPAIKRKIDADLTMNDSTCGYTSGGTTPRRNIHPTAKPIELMRWLIRLLVPPGGTVLDPFLGSGTTAIAAVLEDRPWIGVEREPDYHAIASQRVAWWTREHARKPGRTVAEILKDIKPPPPVHDSQLGLGL